MSSLPPPPVSVLGSDRRLVEDAACARCGYNLRGSTLDQTCPECAMPVAQSVHGDLLRFADRRWLARLLRGAWLILVAVGLMIALSAGILVIATRMPGGPVNLGLEYMAQGTGAAAGAVLVVGYWCVTAREPGRRRRGASSRLVARWGLSGALVVGTVQRALDGPLGGEWLGAYVVSPSYAAASLVAELAVLVLGTLGLLALFRHAMSIARRMPDARLARSSAVVMWGMVISRAAVAALAILVGRLGPVPLQPVVETALAAWLVLSVVFSVWAVVLLVAYARRLRCIVRPARAGRPGGY